MPEPLEGFTVVEMTVAVQGPAAALYLRDMGAEFIKVEPPLGDASRYGRGRDNDWGRASQKKLQSKCAQGSPISSQ